MARVALVSSAGGHLTQAAAIAAALGPDHEAVLFVTGFPAVRDLALPEFARVHRLPCVWGYQQPFGILVSLALGVGHLVRLMRRERPDCLISTGAEVAIPALLVARLLFRRPTLYIESVSRIDTPSLTGRLCRHLAGRTFVQWPGLLDRFGGRAEYHGRLL